MAPFTYDWYQDHSGQDNHYQADNLTVNDIMLDSPTNNYCTLNSTASGGSIFSQGNLKCTTGSNTNRIAVGTMSTPSSGKWYWECKPTSLTGGLGIGVGNLGSYRTSVNSYIGNYAGTYLWYSYSGNGYKDVNGSNSSVAQSFAVNDVVGVALDLDAGTLTMYKNGSSQLQVASGLSGQFEPVFGDGSGSNSATFTVNFGQKDFAHTPPSGFKALNTANMPDPTIKKPSDHFNTKLYTGNGATAQEISLNFNPDLVWIKSRSDAEHHSLVDRVRGDVAVNSNQTIAEYGVSNFDWNTNNTVDVPVYANDYSMNTNSDNYVMWHWKANGSGSTDTSGDIDATVSANTTAGFSIVTFTANGTDSGTVPHGLGVVPKVAIKKDRDSAGAWHVRTTVIDGSDDYMALNTDASASTFSASYGSMTSQFVTNSASANGSSEMFYVFAEVEGFSKIGVYTGNGSTNGPSVYTGFRPGFVMYKRTNDLPGKSGEAGRWEVLDTKRDPSNVADNGISWNLAYAESSGSGTWDIDILSNGFKPRTTEVEANGDGGIFFYMAFAETPFKYANAR